MLRCMFYVLEGYYDNIKSQGKTADTSYYVADSSGSYYYNEVTGEFSTAQSGSPQTYMKTDEETPVQTANMSDIFEAYLETVNLDHFDIGVTSKSVMTKGIFSTTMCRAKLQFASDSNYIFGKGGEKNIAQTEEMAGSFGSDNVRYKGRRQISTITMIPRQKISRSVKYKISAILSDSTIDDFEVHGLETIPERQSLGVNKDHA